MLPLRNSTSHSSVLPSNMSASFFPRSLQIIALLFASFFFSKANVIFESVVQLTGTLKAAKQHFCAAETLQTISPLDRASCALSCGLDTRCKAFLHTEIDRCELLSTPWRSAPIKEGQTLMMRHLRHQSGGKWRFKDSEYIMTEQRVNFTQVKVACASRGMHLWYPKSQEEMRFVEREILCYLPKEYLDVNRVAVGTIRYNLWIGVIDRPLGNCLFADEVTKCSVEKYLPGKPDKADQECVFYWWKNGVFGWNDVYCYQKAAGLCEKTLR